ncbi:hypothetical protein O6H91_13G056900 [Diphasiastrum complanatum]|uniref:Uncharacterized protein n=1 Tax=Diphasiastrum complanatum TaxID=34168 RepID=A0ACC2BW56_DIPCM|nr:hypothetical protein O6H91_13G056900 [Diphasiastrum complanatum]
MSKVNNNNNNNKSVDDVQKCVNLIEALNDAQQDSKNFRTHCHDINASVQLLLPAILNAQHNYPNLLLRADGASAVFHKLNSIMEEAIRLMRKTATLSQLDKLLDQGDTKRRLDGIQETVLKAAQEMDAFLSFQEKLELARSSNSFLQKPGDIPPLVATAEPQRSIRDENPFIRMTIAGDENLIPGFVVEPNTDGSQQHHTTHDNKSRTNIPDLLTGDDPVADSTNTIQTNLDFL